MSVMAFNVGNTKNENASNSDTETAPVSQEYIKRKNTSGL